MSVKLFFPSKQKGDGGLTFFTILAIATLIGAALSNNSTTDDPKFTAEEAGYVGAFKALYMQASTDLKSIIELRYLLEGAIAISDDAKIASAKQGLETALKDIASLKQSYLPKILNTLPPESLTANHEIMKKILLSDDISKNTKFEVENFNSELQSARQFFTDTVDKRDNVTSSGEYSFTYSPILLPIGISSKGFFIKQSFETPIGSFTIAHSNSQATGIKNMIIVSNGQLRLFRINRPFRVFVPSSYGVSLESKDSETMIVVVCPSASKDSCHYSES